MKNINAIAANRFLRKEKTNAYYCSVPLVEAFNQFKLDYSENISLSSFINYVPEKFKPPHRFSDLCSYCEKNKV